MGKQSIWRWMVASLLLVWPLVSACSGNGSDGASPCDKTGAIKGLVTRVAQMGSPARATLVLDSRGEQGGSKDPLVAVVLAGTQVFQKQDGECRELPMSVLRSGLRVQVQTTGTVKESYPPQVDVTEVLILPSLT